MVDNLPQIREPLMKDEYKSAEPNGHLKPRPVVPGMHRKRTPEEMVELHRKAAKERAERYRSLCELLNLHVIAYPNGDLEISWFGGVWKLEGTP
jgi:hypothetical protein